MEGGSPAAPEIKLVTYPGVGPAVCRELNRAERYVMGTAYCFDYPPGCDALRNLKATRSVSVRILLDKAQLYRQRGGRSESERVLDLMEWGVEFRAFAPDRGDFSALHAKAWLVDGSTQLCGSPNFTRDGMECSEELLLIIKSAEELVAGKRSRCVAADHVISLSDGRYD